MGHATVGSRMSPKPHVGKAWSADGGTIDRIFKKWGLEGSLRLLGTWPQRGLLELVSSSFLGILATGLAVLPCNVPPLPPTPHVLFLPRPTVHGLKPPSSDSKPFLCLHWFISGTCSGGKVIQGDHRLLYKPHDNTPQRQKHPRVSLCVLDWAACKFGTWSRYYETKYFLKDIFMFRVRYFLSPRLVASPSDFAFSVWSGKPQVLDLMVDPIFSVITIGPSGFCQHGQAPLLS